MTNKFNTTLMFTITLGVFNTKRKIPTALKLKKNEIMFLNDNTNLINQLL